MCLIKSFYGLYSERKNFIILDTEMSNDHKIFLLYESSGKRLGKFKAELAFFLSKKIIVLKSVAFFVRKNGRWDTCSPADILKWRNRYTPSKKGVNQEWKNNFAQINFAMRRHFKNGSVEMFSLL